MTEAGPFYSHQIGPKQIGQTQALWKRNHVGTFPVQQHRDAPPTMQKAYHSAQTKRTLSNQEYWNVDNANRPVTVQEMREFAEKYKVPQRNANRHNVGDIIVVRKPKNPQLDIRGDPQGLDQRNFSLPHIPVGNDMHPHVLNRSNWHEKRGFNQPADPRY